MKITVVPLLLIGLSASSQDSDLPEKLQKSQESRLLNDSIAAFDPLEFDANADGWLDEQEKRAAMAAMQKRAAREVERKNAETLYAYDANHNGKLDGKETEPMQAEIAEAKARRQDWSRQRQLMLSRYDANKDGELSLAERQAMAMGEVEEQVFSSSRVLRRYDKNGDGQLDEGEKAKARTAWLETGDRNHNGKLDLAEMYALIRTEQARAKELAGRKDKVRETPEEQRLRQFDLDGDGQLNAEEKRRADENDRQKRALQIKAPPMEE